MLIKNLENKNRELYSRYQELLEENDIIKRQLRGQIFPNLVADDLVSVQPMMAPTGKVFSINYRYKNKND